MLKKFRTPYEADYDPLLYATPVDSTSQTQQHCKDDCDINKIVTRYRPDELAMINQHGFGDYDPEGKFLKFRDYQSNMYTLTKAKTAFEELPAAVRKAFRNDPANLLASIETKDEKAYEYGFLERPAEPAKKPDVPGEPGA